MDFNKIKKLAQEARDLLTNQVLSKLDAVVKEGSSAWRENEKAVRELKRQINQLGPAQVAEQVAYTWFNRFIALMFMDQNGFNSIRVVGSVPDSSRPEILSEAISGNIPNFAPSESITSLLEGRTPSSNPHEEVYKLLLVSVCNNLSDMMPFMFEEIGNFTELLLPEDLLSKSSILSNLRNVLTLENCQDVEIIGWLYQFYISKKKDQVFAALQENEKILEENIPAATQLFTPDWIVRFLIENSLGRLWLLNRPNSKIVEQLKYYLASEESIQNFPKINSPEELTICDPACGSGHMLSFAFDLLHFIYEEEGYNPTEIPELILSKNIFGMEIDDRAGALASFVLAMKAAKKIGWNKFAKMGIVPKICVYQNTTFSNDELREVKNMVGQRNFTDKFKHFLSQFENAKTFGSLIKSEFSKSIDVIEQLNTKDFSRDLIHSKLQERISSILNMGYFLDQKYHIVVTNPPYLAYKGMNADISNFAKKFFPHSKFDLYSMFMERSISMLKPFGYLAMINMQSWMFRTKLENFRRQLLRNATPVILAHIGPHGFDTIGGEVVSTTAFVLSESNNQDISSVFIDLVDGQTEAEKIDQLNSALQDPKIRYMHNSNSFFLLPGATLAYWISDSILATYSESKLSDLFESCGHNKTTNNEIFLRYVWEVSLSERGRKKKWLLYAKGGKFRKWYGNVEHLIDWSSGAREYYQKSRSGAIIPEEFWYQSGVTWSNISTKKNCFRLLPNDATFDRTGIFPNQLSTKSKLLGILNSPFSKEALKIFNPGMAINLNDLKTVPVPKNFSSIEFEKNVKKLIDISQTDWDSLETSWGFSSLPLLSSKFKSKKITDSYDSLRKYWDTQIIEMHKLEEASNQTVIEAYGLIKELSPKIPISEITLNCNPDFRYDENLSSEKKESRLLKDTITEFISYAVGCMFGRYSIESPGLILASQGQTIKRLS